MSPPTSDTSENDPAEGTPREPLLAREASSSAPAGEESTTNHIPITTTTTTDNSTSDNDATDNDTPPPPSADLLGCCTIVVVLVGLFLVLFCALLPVWIYWALQLTVLPLPYDQNTCHWMTAAILVIQGMHIRALWVSARYLWWVRTLVLPMRRGLLPLVPFVAKIESIREHETTHYYKVPRSRGHNGGGADNATDNAVATATTATPQFRRSVRRRYRRMQTLYERRGVKHVSKRSETSLVLRDIMHILWEHQQRTTSQTWPIGDFVKRALVVTVVPDGILDLYYLTTDGDENDGDELVCLQFSILQGTVWHWFMYFCVEDASRAGIWWHGALLALHRGHTAASSTTSSSCTCTSVRYVNAQMHQADSKLHAGYTAAPHTNADLLAHLYPWGVTTRHIPQEVLDVRLWDATDAPSSS